MVDQDANIRTQIPNTAAAAFHNTRLTTCIRADGPTRRTENSTERKMLASGGTGALFIMLRVSYYGPDSPLGWYGVIPWD